MFDKSLKQDLQQFKLGSDNIYDLKLRYIEIKKIISNRTKEKYNLLKLFLDYHVIDYYTYQELCARVKYDYKIAFRYIMGLIPNLE